MLYLYLYLEGEYKKGVESRFTLCLWTQIEVILLSSLILLKYEVGKVDIDLFDQRLNSQKPTTTL